jgi:hypothetical protein
MIKLSLNSVQNNGIKQTKMVTGKIKRYGLIWWKFFKQKYGNRKAENYGDLGHSNGIRLA